MRARVIGRVGIMVRSRVRVRTKVNGRIRARVRVRTRTRVRISSLQVLTPHLLRPLKALLQAEATLG